MTKLIGTREVREALSCSPRYAVNLMHWFAARGQGYQIGRSLKVSKAAFESWLEAQRVTEEHDRR